MENINVKFAKNLKMYRKMSGISQEELAKRTGLNRSFISLIECNKRNISLSNIEIIAKGLNIEPYLLIK